MALTRTTKWLAAGGIVGAALLVVSGRDAPPGKRRARRPTHAPKGWENEIRSIAAPIEQQTGWPRLGDFLVSVARFESGGKVDACNVSEHGYCAPNSARGWFQLRPKSALAFQLSHLQDEPELLYDPRWAVALAAWYAERLRKYAAPGQTLNWLAVRRGWALPSLVPDIEETQARSVKVRHNYEATLPKVGLPEEFMYERAFPPGFDWPGIEGVLKIVGAHEVA